MTALAAIPKSKGFPDFDSPRITHRNHAEPASRRRPFCGSTDFLA